MVMGPADHSDKSLAVERLATDGSNWPLWKATLKSYFEFRNLVKHINGTADRPPDPPSFPKAMSSQMMRRLRLLRLRRGWKSVLEPVKTEVLKI